MITGYLNATDFIEYCRDFDDNDNNCDWIYLYISSYENDYTGTSLGIGVPQYTLLPCENLMLSIALEHQVRIDRETSRCRQEYLPAVTRIVKPVLEPKDLFNAIFAPTLPYDQLTCDRLCTAKYWLPKCNCYMSWMSHRYAGSPANMTSCASWSDDATVNCTKWHGNTETPSEVLTACECYPQCEEQSYNIVNEQRQRYTLGNADSHSLAIKFIKFSRICSRFLKEFFKKISQSNPNCTK